MSLLTENLEKLERFGVLNRYHMGILENNLKEHNEEIRNATIDEFVSELKKHTTYNVVFDVQCVSTTIINTIANRMKSSE